MNNWKRWDNRVNWISWKELTNRGMRVGMGEIPLNVIRVSSQQGHFLKKQKKTTKSLVMRIRSETALKGGVRVQDRVNLLQHPDNRSCVITRDPNGPWRMIQYNRDGANPGEVLEVKITHQKGMPLFTQIHDLNVISIGDGFFEFQLNPDKIDPRGYIER